MKLSKFFLLLTAAGGLFFLAACATPEARIKKNPEAFAQLSPEQQDLVKQGKIAIGFDQEAVRLALGDPDRVRTRQDANGTNEIWSYVTYTGPDNVILYRGFYHRYYAWGDPLYPYYLNYPGRHEHDHFRVTFRDGRVSSIDQEMSSDD
jgi:hypothetical protein